MKFSYNWLQSFFQEKLPEPKKLSNLIALHFFEVEEIEKKDKDWVINIDVLPNRATDCFSHIGIVKEISAITGLKNNFDKDRYNFKKSEISKKNKNEIKINIENKDDCSRYTVASIKNIKISQSPKWIIEKLNSCGIQSINNIVDIVNYVMLETGQPMHAFDYSEIKDKKIIIRKAKEGEEITGLDDKRYILSKKDIVISDSEKILGVAGIKGGKNAEISDNTNHIIIESANFNRLTIRKTSNNLKLRTDASIRFEHGLDPNLTEIGINRTIELISKIIPESKVIEKIDLYPEKIKNKKIKLNLEYLDNLLGIKIDPKESEKILKSLSFKIIKKEKKYLTIEVPSERIDVNYQEDLIEEVARIYGYEKIEKKTPTRLITSIQKNSDLSWINKTKNLLRAIGFTEIYNYSFINENQAITFDINLNNLFEVEKPVSADQKYLRPSLLINLVKNLKENEKNFKNFKIFEIGKIFNKKENISEKKEIAGLITGNSFYETKGIVEFLLKEYGLNNFIFKEYKEGPSYLHLNKRAKITIDSNDIGYIGSFSNKIKQECKIKSDSSFFVIDFDKIKDKINSEKLYKNIPKIPSISRDLSILVPKYEKYENVVKVLIDLKIKILQDLILFDVYEGNEIPENKKNFAIRLIFRDDKKTLTTEEVNSIHEKIINKIQENSNWKIRK
jgi:phenylalanyl-tRNA synthetase beta chain